ncbi:MAG TPA: hypothetical protein VEB00_06345 [Clostridia bacterium]|nr:hypothetical protein [Clostridia bacterium]
MNISKDIITVITAAIMAMTGGKTKIVIKSIRRTSNRQSDWVLSGWLKKKTY